MPFCWLTFTLAGYTREGLLTALSMVCPVKPTLPKWLEPLIPPATCVLGNQWLQKQAPFLAGFNYCSELDQRIYLSPLQGGSSKTRGLPSTGRWRAGPAEPPHVHGHRVLSHQGSGNLACMNCLATATRLSFCQAHLQIA